MVHQKQKPIISKRLLLVTAWYYPFIHPRAHRWTALAEHWAAQGYEVHVVCAGRGDCPPETRMNGVSVHRIGFDSLKEVAYACVGATKGRGRVGAGVRQPNWLVWLFAGLYNLIWKKVYFPDDACLWYFPARRKVLKLLRQKPFDALITVSLPFTGHLLGLAAKRRFPSLNWLADIGDPFTIQVQPPNNARLYGALSRRLEESVLSAADQVTVTNPAAKGAYLKKFGFIAHKIAVIPPLYQPSATDRPLEPSLGSAHSPENPAAIDIGYFGAFYSPVRTPDAFLDLLEKTFALRPDLKTRLRVHVYGDIFPEFFNKLTGQAAIRLYGLRSRQEARSAMDQMDVLINIGNITEYQLPSKAVECLASGKPVVHLSYVESDPFLEFWEDWPGLFCLRVTRNGIDMRAVHAWIAFLESEKKTLPESVRLLRLQPFTVEAVAAGYLRLMEGEPSFQSIPGIAAVPLHR